MALWGMSLVCFEMNVSLTASGIFVPLVNRSCLLPLCLQSWEWAVSLVASRSAVSVLRPATVTAECVRCGFPRPGVRISSPSLGDRHVFS